MKLYRNDDSNPIDSTLYHHLVGSLIYLTTPQAYLAFVVSIVSRFMLDPWAMDWKPTKRILRYLHGIVVYGLVYRSTKDFRMVGYIDWDWVGCMDDIKCTSGYTFNMVSVAVAWSTKK